MKEDNVFYSGINSRTIAKIMEDSHSQVCKDIRIAFKYIKEQGVDTTGMIDFSIDDNGDADYETYLLSKIGSLVFMGGYGDRGHIIELLKKWQEYDKSQSIKTGEMK